MHTEPQKSSQGYYVFRRSENFIWWLAWSTWLHDELGQSFLPDTLQGFTQFPPETQQQADLYAEYINGIRKRIKWGQTVPEHPKPWVRWTPTEMERLERRELEFRNPPMRKSQEQVADILAGARKRYPRVFRRNKFEGEKAEREPIPYEESNPETLAEMRESLQAKQPRRGADE
jgi:hypothetical protein